MQGHQFHAQNPADLVCQLDTEIGVTKSKESSTQGPNLVARLLVTFRSKQEQKTQ